MNTTKVMKVSYQKLRRKYQSLETDRLIELNQSGGLTETEIAALRDELENRGFKFIRESSKPVKTIDSKDESNSRAEAVWTVWFRLISTMSIVFMLLVTMQSKPIRSRTVDAGEVIVNSIKLVLIGPGLAFGEASDTFAGIISIVFWLLIIKTGLKSSNVRSRRWFHSLLVVYIVLTSVGLIASMFMGLAAMAGAM